MSRAVRINATIDPDLLKRVDQFAKSRYEDRSTAIRQLLALALRELAQDDAIDAYKSGRITLREMGQILGLDYWGAHDFLESKGVAIAQGRRDESKQGLEELLRSQLHTKRQK